MIDKCIRFLQNYKNDYKKDIAIYKYHPKNENKKKSNKILPTNFMDE